MGGGGGWGGAQYHGDWPVGERITIIWALSAFHLVLLYLPQKARNGNCERGCEGNINSEEVESKLLKGGFLD